MVKGNDSVFDRLYVGKKEDADKSKVITGTADTDGTYRFTFDVPAEMKNQALSVVPGNSNNGGEIKWYTAKDCTITVPDVVPAPTSIPQPTASPRANRHTGTNRYPGADPDTFSNPNSDTGSGYSKWSI